MPQWLSDYWLLPVVVALFIISIRINAPGAYSSTACLNVDVPKGVRNIDVHPYCECVKGYYWKEQKAAQIESCNRRYLR